MIIKKCLVCGKEFKVCPSIIKRGKGKYCSKDCCHKFLTKKVKCYGKSRRSKYLKKFYKTWGHIKDRCYDKKTKCYFRYGGRGIVVEWKNIDEFANDMYDSFLKHCKKFGGNQTTIDRIDNDGNYSKANCRWATQKDQQRNKRNNRLITFKNKTQCMVEWAEECNLSIKVIWYRLNRGWSVERTLLTPIRKYKIYKRTKIKL